MNCNKEGNAGVTIKEELTGDGLVACKEDEILSNGISGDHQDLQFVFKDELGGVVGCVETMDGGFGVGALPRIDTAAETTNSTDNQWYFDSKTTNISEPSHSSYHLRLKNKSKFVCNDCGHRSYGSVGLKKHLKTHATERTNISLSQGLRNRGKTHSPSEASFTCHICDHKSHTKKLIKQHILTHLGEELFACNMCDFRTQKMSSLKKHKWIHSSEKPYACDKCNYRTAKSEALKKHARIHSGEKPFACGICEHRLYRTASGLKVHMKLKHPGKKLYACDVCDFCCGNKNNLDEHMKIHATDQSFAGDFTDCRAGQSSSLEGHILNPSSPESYDLNTHVENAATRITKNLNTFKTENPNDTVNKDGWFVCHACNYKAHTRELMKRHIKRHSGEKPYACEICDYRGVEKLSLRRHMMIHTGEKPFGCDFCDYRCCQRAHLREHMKLHSGETPKRTSKIFTCHTCDYQGSREQLRRHMINHGAPPYSCKTCDYKAASFITLRTHVMTHSPTAEKLFPCEYCTYSTNHVTHLKNHVMVHTGEKPFACDICGFRARQKSQLKTHVLIHTGEKPYSCDHCSYRCSQKHRVKLHVKLWCPSRKPKPKSPGADKDQPTESSSCKEPTILCDSVLQEIDLEEDKKQF